MSQSVSLSLDAREIALIKSCVPVLEQYGQAITTRFYTLLFEAHPELLNLFNHSNQREGLQQQALASAIYAAAANIDTLETILPVVKQIAHKHVSLGVKPEHYPLVGEALISALHEVLGSALTPELDAAWQKAYALIARIFVQVEQGLYDEAQQQSGGWVDFRPFVVMRKALETDEIVALYLKSVDGQPIAGFQPGQYVTVKIHANGHDHLRQYSLSMDDDQDFYRIAAKRENGGLDEAGIVSNYLHDHVEAEDTLLVSAPAGVFTLDDTTTRPVALLAAGIGITPLLAMLHTLRNQAPLRPATLAYAVRNGRYHAFKKELQALVQSTSALSVATFYEQPLAEDVLVQDFDFSGRISSAWLQAFVAPDAEIYICGPRLFMQSITQMLLVQGRSLEQIHYEVFGPALAFSIV